MNLSAGFIRRPIATSLLMGGIFLVGLVVYPLLPVAPLPQVDFPTIQVSASLPGASPETMASSVATPLEYQFAQISGLSQMTSASVLGSTQITLQFDLGRHIDAAAQDVQTGIDAAGEPGRAQIRRIRIKNILHPLLHREFRHVQIDHGGVVHDMRVVRPAKHIARAAHIRGKLIYLVNILVENRFPAFAVAKIRDDEIIRRAQREFGLLQIHSAHPVTLLLQAGD